MWRGVTFSLIARLTGHTLAGVGAALFMLVSKYGFTDVGAGPRREPARRVTGRPATPLPR